MKVSSRISSLLLLIIPTTIFSIQSYLYQTPSYILTSGITLLNDSPGDIPNSPSESSHGVTSGLTYLFSENDLAIKTLALGWRLKQFGWGVSMNSLSNSLVNDASYTINSSYTLSLFSLGLNLRMLDQKVKGYSHLQGITTDIGIGWRWNQLESTLSLFNIYPQKIEDVELLQKTQFQIVYQPVDLLKLGFMIEMEDGFNAQYNFSSKMVITEMLHFYCGYKTDVNRLTTGINLIYRKLFFNYSVCTHPELELTHAFEICYKW